MKLLGNVLWFLIVGIWSFFIWVIVGIIWSITIIGIPFGVQCFKIAAFALFPFGKTVNTDFNSHPIANILWIIFFGWEIALGYIISGALLFITIIGIPFAKQNFKLASISFIPFGSNVI